MGTRSGAGTGWTGWTRAADEGRRARAAAGAASGPRRQGHGERRPRAEAQNGGWILNLNRTWTGRISSSSTRLFHDHHGQRKQHFIDITAETSSIHRTFKCRMTLLCEFVLAREMDGAVGTPNTRLLSLDLASPGLRSLAVSGLVCLGCNGWQELESRK